MIDIDTGFITVAIVFGLLMGFGLGRNADDRTATVAVTTASIAIGAVTWIVASTGTTPETAGAAMTIGGAAAIASLLVTGRRPT